eukprot:GHVP01040438.1.p1 GENE.GHVP01040438.1~~GHVP01040438.1.p1  ORF type:complete len:291 (+),score=42.47 GHVP01040438.1:458-1330(+)
MTEFLNLLLNAEAKDWNNKSLPSTPNFFALIRSICRFLRVIRAVFPDTFVNVILFSASHCSFAYSSFTDTFDADALVSGVHQFLQWHETEKEDQMCADESLISCAFGKAILAFNKYKMSTLVKQVPNFVPKSRIILFEVSSNLYLKQHEVLCNYGYVAKDLEMPVDLLYLGENKPAVALQQICEFSVGCFVDLKTLCNSTKTSQLSDETTENKAEAILYETILFHFLPNSIAREHLEFAKPQKVELSTTCYCHSKKVEIATVCSSCLRVYCDLSIRSCNYCVSSVMVDLD